MNCICGVPKNHVKLNVGSLLDFALEENKQKSTIGDDQIFPPDTRLSLPRAKSGVEERPYRESRELLGASSLLTTLATI